MFDYHFRLNDNFFEYVFLRFYLSFTVTKWIFLNDNAVESITTKISHVKYSSKNL